VDKLVIAAGLILVIGFSTPDAFGADGDAELWQAAVETARLANETGVVFGTLKVLNLVKKKDGSIDERSEFVYRSVGTGDALEIEIVSAVRDGEDVTEEVRESEREAKKDDPQDEDDGDGVNVSLNPTYHPFSPKAQERITRRFERRATLDGRPTMLYSFRHDRENDQGVLTGKAWIDAISGVPLQVEVQPDPLPKYVDEMVTRIRFKVDEEGRWVPDSGETHGSGGFLWISRIMETTYRFSDFRLRTDS
jgi:hypothetical protein